MGIKAPTVRTQIVPRTKYMSRVRFVILAMLFIMTTINYADRVTISIAGSAMQKELGIDTMSLGYILSAFGWAYVIAQIPSGWLFDRFSSECVYTFSILLWSVFTLAQGAIGFFTDAAAIAMVFCLRFLVDAAETPSFPANNRIVAAWFPANERGTAAAIFNSAQYAATVVFAPLMAQLVHTFGWYHVFIMMGVVGIVMAVMWRTFVHEPENHPGVNHAEIEYIKTGGGLMSIDRVGVAKTEGPKLNYVRQLLQNRMLMSVYIAQYYINAPMYFFITWFPVYLMQTRGMPILKAGFIASIPTACDLLDGILDRIISDTLLRRGTLLSMARKIPIMLGMLLSMAMMICNYADAQVIVVAAMALSSFGKGLGVLGWAVNSDTAPKQTASLSGALVNTLGNLSSITTPIAIGYIVNTMGSFNGALVYVGIHALVAIVCYLFVVGKIKRVKPEPL